MTHPLTPREKVLLKPCPFCGGEAEMFSMSDRIGVRCADVMCAGSHRLPAAGEDSVALWNRRTALASGSGDHAELARLAEAAEHDPEYDGRSFEVAANPATVLALLAENAALRAEHVHLVEQKEGAEDALFNALSRATEAERKLAEAVELKHMTDGQLFAAINAAVTITRDRNGVDNGAVCISPEKFRTFLSKEAERG